MPDKPPNEFVIASSVRTKIVTTLAEGAVPTDELLDAISASGSAVYDAVSTLADRGLVSERGDAWELTAHGQLVADSIEQWQSTEAFLGADPEYWKRHDASVIPPKFRRRLPEIGEYEVVRSDESHVTRHHQASLSRLRAADHCLILTPFFSVEYQAATPDVPETRMLVHRSAVDTRADRIRDGRPDAEDLDEAELRLTECEFAMSVGEDFLVFGLPTQSGDPATATVVSETDAAVEWGRDLFEAKWDDSDPMEEYIAREHADVWG